MQEVFFVDQTACHKALSHPEDCVQTIGKTLLAPTGALVMMMVYYIYIQRPLFQIFTQSIDAIDVTSVTLSRFNSINVIDVTRVTRECRM